MKFKKILSGDSKKVRGWKPWFLAIMMTVCSGCVNGTVLLETQEMPVLLRVTGAVSEAATSTSTPTLTLTQEVRESTKIPTLGPNKTSAPTLEFQLCSPLAGHAIEELVGIVSSPYDPPPMGKDDRHQGVDFAYYNQGGRDSIEGEGVTAILPGKVVIASHNRLPYGNMVIIETQREQIPESLVEMLGIMASESLYHLYAHFNDSPLPEAGDWVACGELMGEVGKSGYNIPVAHLHLETRIGPSGAIFDEMGYYDTRASEVARENYETWRMSGVFRHFNPMVLFSE